LAILVVEAGVIVRTMLVTCCVDSVVLEAVITYDTDDIRQGHAAIDVVLSDLKRAPRYAPVPGAEAAIFTNARRKREP